MFTRRLVVICKHNMQTEKAKRKQENVDVHQQNGKNDDDNKRREQTATIYNNPFSDAKRNEIENVGRDIVGCVEAEGISEN